MIKKLLGEVEQGIDIIDIGCRGSLDDKWKPLENAVNLHGFDLDRAECERLSRVPNSFRSVKYHPYAIAGSSGPATLYVTRNAYCCSLLKPDTPWLNRFAFRTMLEVLEERRIQSVGLAEVEEFRNLDVDALKCDSQGLELEILKGAGGLLDRAIYVETESGFTSNYVGESTQAEVDQYMRSRGFLLFDLKLSRMSHDNVLQGANPDRAMLLWSESVWLRDYVALFNARTLVPGANIDRKKAIKVLAVCAIQGCADFGLECAQVFWKLGLLSEEEFESLKNEEAWRLVTPVEEVTRSAFLNFVLRLLPWSIRKGLSREAALAAKQTHVLRHLVGGGK